MARRLKSSVGPEILTVLLSDLAAAEERTGYGPALQASSPQTRSLSDRFRPTWQIGSLQGASGPLGTGPTEVPGGAGSPARVEAGNFTRLSMGTALPPDRRLLPLGASTLLRAA